MGRLTLKTTTTPPAPSAGRATAWLEESVDGVLLKTIDENGLIKTMVGTKILTGDGTPASGTGEIGNLYINVGPTGTIGDVFEKTTATVWTLRGNIRGPQGPVSDVANIVVVQQEPEVGEFDDIQEAIDSILDASASNPYVVKVGPGEWTGNLQMKEFVYIFGSGDEVTIIKPSNPAAHLIEAVDDSGIQFCMLTGVTGMNRAAIHHNSLTGTTFKSFYVEHCRFGANDTHVLVEAMTSSTAVFLNSCRFGGIHAFRRGFVALNSGGNAGRIVIRNLTTNGITTPYPEDVLFATGTGTQLVINSAQIRSSAVTTGNCMRLADGAEARVMGLNIKNFNKAVFLENTGAAPKLHAQPIMIEDCTTDLDFAHPSSIVHFFGSADRTKVSINTSITESSIAYADTSSSSVGIVVVGDVLQSTRHDQLVNLTKLARETNTMGVLTGGVLTAGIGLNLNVSAGTGFVVDPATQAVVEIEWDNEVLALTANQTEYVFIDEDGTVSKSISQPNLTETAILGRVETSASGIRFIDPSPLNSFHLANRYSEFFRVFFGSLYFSGSSVVETGTRQLNISTGIYAFDGSTRTLTGASPATFTTVRSDGLGNFTFTTGQMTVSNSQYDDGTGTLAAIPAGKFAAHILYGVDDPSGDKYFLQFSQAVYNSLAEAQSSEIPVPPQSFKEGVVRIAKIVVEEGNAAFPANPVDIRPRLGFASPTTSASSDHGSLSNLDVPSHHLWAFLHDGTRPMSGNFDGGGFDVTNIGNFGAVNGFATLDGTGKVPTAQLPTLAADPSSSMEMFDDFVCANEDDDELGVYSWSVNSAGTGNSVARVNGEPGRPGIMRIIGGTVDTGRAAINLGTDGMNNIRVEGQAGLQTICEWGVRLTGTLNTFEMFVCGLGDVAAAVGDQANGIYFQVLGADTNWHLVSANASTRTRLNSGVPYVSGNWFRLRFVHTVNTGLVEGFINGVSVGTIATNLPTSAISPLAKADGVGGGSSLPCDLDYFYLRQNGLTR